MTAHACRGLTCSGVAAAQLGLLFASASLAILLLWRALKVLGRQRAAQEGALQYLAPAIDALAATGLFGVLLADLVTARILNPWRRSRC